MHAANGAGMNISHIGNSIIPTHDQNIHLKNILHVPDGTKNLASAHRLTRDNNTFVEIHRDDSFASRIKSRGRCFLMDHAEMLSTLFPSHHHFQHHPSKFMESPSHPIIDDIVG